MVQDFDLYFGYLSPNDNRGLEIIPYSNALKYLHTDIGYLTS